MNIRLLFGFSIAGHSQTLFPGNKMYNASKHALKVLTEGLRHELAIAGDGHIKASVSLCRNHFIIYNGCASGRKSWGILGWFPFERDITTYAKNPARLCQTEIKSNQNVISLNVTEICWCCKRELYRQRYLLYLKMINMPQKNVYINSLIIISSKWSTKYFYKNNVSHEFI